MDTTILRVAIAAILTASMLCGLALADGEDGEDGVGLPAVAGVVGLRPVEDSSCAAVWVEIPDGKALSGVRWFNNDAFANYPQVLLESGEPDYPVSLLDCRIVAEEVTGASSDWSTIEFNETVGCESAGLYVLFRFPVGSEYNFDGAGGGAAIGYSVNGDGCPGWISADGVDWVPFSGAFRFSVQPELVDDSEASVIMKGLNHSSQQGEAAQAGNAFLYPAPNPFNPSTKLTFRINHSSTVELNLYDVRGLLVRRLVRGPYSAGAHEVFWDGRDDSGRSVASGHYLAQIVAGKFTATRRLVLVR